MTVRTPALALALLLALTGCGEGTSDNTVSSAPPSGTACTPSGSGTTDLKTKPVVKPPAGPAPSETTVVDIVCGTGDEAKQGSNVKVKYVGVLHKDGQEFDSSWSRSPSETLPVKVGGNVIPGFSKGIAGMRVGGRREVTIPSKDGYGDNANGPIPAGSTLVFVIDLVEVAKPAPRTPCTASGSGTTDLKVKPVPVVPKGPAPAETTTTDIVCGTGAQADEGSAVEVKYVGVLYTSGKEFDSSWKTGPEHTLPFTVGQGVVPGFSTGVTGMKVGGRRMIVIPAKDGYGPQAQGDIPPNSTLVFVIDLVKVS